VLCSRVRSSDVDGMKRLTVVDSGVSRPTRNALVVGSTGATGATGPTGPTGPAGQDCMLSHILNVFYSNNAY